MYITSDFITPWQLMTDGDFKAMIDEVDEDGSGEISFDEFVTMIVRRMESGLMDDANQVRSFLVLFSMCVLV